MGEFELDILKNRKPDSWYDDYYNREEYFNSIYSGILYFNEHIKLQKEYDEKIDNGQYLERKTEYIIQGYKEFIIENNSFKRNKEILDIYKNLGLIYESTRGSNYLNKLIKKCLLALEQGYLVTNQLFILHDWISKVGDD